MERGIDWMLIVGSIGGTTLMNGAFSLWTLKMKRQYTDCEQWDYSSL